MVRLLARPRVDRLLFDRLFFDLALPLVARLAALPLRRFVWVPRFPLIFFLPELRFVCRAILSSPRIRAPRRICSTTYLQRADLSSRPRSRRSAVRLRRNAGPGIQFAAVLRHGDPVRGSTPGLPSRPPVTNDQRRSSRPSTYQGMSALRTIRHKPGVLRNPFESLTFGNLVARLSHHCGHRSIRCILSIYPSSRASCSSRRD